MDYGRLSMLNFIGNLQIIWQGNKTKTIEEIWESQKECQTLK